MSIISISAAVGINAANRVPDVMKVQTMLNHFIGNRKLVGCKPLAIDGKCGPKTREAILMLQIQNGLVSDEHLNGQVRPGGMTVNFMNTKAGPVPPVPSAAPAAPAAAPSADDQAVEAAIARIKQAYNLTAAEESQWKIILKGIWKSEFSGFSSAADAAGTASNIHKWVDFALDIFTVARTGFGAAPGSLLYAAGSISWSVGQVLGFIGPFLQFYSFVLALEHAMRTDCRIYNAIAVAYGTAYWAHGGIKPVACKTFLNNWRTAPPQHRSPEEELERYWRKGYAKAIDDLDTYAQKQASRIGKGAAEGKRAMRTLLGTINGTTLSRAVLTAIAKEYRAHGDVNEADAIDSYARNQSLRYPY